METKSRAMKQKNLGNFFKIKANQKKLMVLGCQKTPNQTLHVIRFAELHWTKGISLFSLFLKTFFLNHELQIRHHTIAA